jgi:hypothetical protein
MPYPGNKKITVKTEMMVLQIMVFVRIIRDIGYLPHNHWLDFLYKQMKLEHNHDDLKGNKKTEKGHG